MASPATMRDDSGQATVELVALLPVLGVLVLGLWQVAVFGHAVWSASAAARIASRAAAVGAPSASSAAVTARRVAGRGARLRVIDGGAVRVAVPVRAVIGGAVLTTVSTTARFEPQR